MAILTNKYEMNKSSELCQVVFYTESKKEKRLFNISALQLDLLNSIFYQSNKFLVQNKIELDSSDTTTVELDLSELSAMLNRYKQSQYEYMVSVLDELSDVKVIINALNKNKQMHEVSLTRFILSIKLSKHLDTNKKKIRIIMDNEVLKRVSNIKSMFSKMFLSIQLSMNSKYSKLLYELLKDYHGIKTITIPYDHQLDLLNVTEETMKMWSNFRPHVIEKAISEINEKSDILVSYEPIKEKLDGQRKQVTKIKFNIEKQPESRLQELGLIQQSIQSHKFYNKSKSKLDQLVQNGYKVIDPDMWIETDIKKNENQYDAEIRIDVWLRETAPEHRNMIYEHLASNIEDCDDPMVTIDNYKIIGVFSKDASTKNATETIAMMNAAVTATE